MALNFPNTPTNAQSYVDPNGHTWVYETTTNSWTAQGAPLAGMVYMGSINITTAPPTGAATGSVFTVSTGGTPNVGFIGLPTTVATGAQVIYDGTKWQLMATVAPNATEAVKGIVELATAAETTAGTDATRAVHPKGLKVELDKLKLWTRTGTNLAPKHAGDVVNISAGTAALPGLTPVGDPNSGLFSPGADQVAISTNGTENARIASGSLLLGKSTAGGKALLQIQGLSGGPALPGGVSLSRSVFADHDDIGFVTFANGSGQPYAQIKGVCDGSPTASSHPGAIAFSTTPAGATVMTERMKIYANGSVQVIGPTTSLTSLFQTKNATQDLFRVRNDGYIETGHGAASPWNVTTASSANAFIDPDRSLRRSTSSIKYKTDVETLGDSYADAILNVRPVWYRSTCSGDKSEWGHWGFIAEEVAVIDPRLCLLAEKEDGTLEPEGVQYDRFVPHLLNLIKRQKTQIEAMEARLSALEAAAARR